VRGFDASKQVWVEEALQRYERPLVRYAAHLVGNTDLARDIVQDTFLRLWSADQAEVDGRLAAWLYTVCRNRALDVMRKERRMVPLESVRTDVRPSDSPTPGTVLDTAERRESIQGILTTLPQNQREVIRLKFQDGLSYKNISEVTGLSVSNVGYLIHIGIRTIRRRLAAQGGVA